MPAQLAETIVFNEPAAMGRAAAAGLGVTLMSVPDALPYLDTGSLVRLLPQWHADLGVVSIYYASRTLLPAKTRAFIDFLVDAFRRQGLPERFSATGGKG